MSWVSHEPASDASGGQIITAPCIDAKCTCVLKKFETFSNLIPLFGLFSPYSPFVSILKPVSQNASFYFTLCKFAFVITVSFVFLQNSRVRTTREHNVQWNYSARLSIPDVADESKSLISVTINASSLPPLPELISLIAFGKLFLIIIHPKVLLWPTACPFSLLSRPRCLIEQHPDHTHISFCYLISSKLETFVD